MIPCFIGLGSNLSQPRQQLLRAIDALAALPSCRLDAVSRFYGSKAIGPGAQDDYVNAAAKLSTSLDPHALLTALQGIEQQQGRQRAIRWGARTLDLDLLLYGDARINSHTLTVPHPAIPERPFVLAPLAELDAQAPGIHIGQAVDYLSADKLWLISP
ncbi:2-amino-4-hydroxy-6-hydroxymethyldihydropteridine diphosphokinase [Spongiibacter sp. IMCC21906]|uniref:2-amino-4-hydroxy-6- hydroxymethyldihydropteridine diphosphokinase n=1 Tax=Spongiibacter sp. IMCC21906 TaxID=1620392 RepID=UPI00062DCDD7|nr:2-amino-4-hydroxy-6-hydroxymethyldihydropteridine diphosphokinase [Spongiibacter sp. IMCC21906]AKH68556.1 2-amino-4-hydroxy-6-hydroxymethyldihydropteridine diphosphokinase [Spongiibacter sp. IMCC21906]